MDYREMNQDERQAAAEERARDDMDRLDLAELLADEARDNPPLTEDEYLRSLHFDHFLDRVQK